MANDNCSTQALAALFQIQEMGRDAIKETIEASGIKNDRTRRTLHKELEESYREYLDNLKGQLTDENLVNEGILEKLSLKTQRQLFNMIDRVRTVRNTVKTIDAVASSSKTKNAVPGILRQMLALLEAPMTALKTRINSINQRIWAETLEGGTSKNADDVEQAKIEYLDALAGGRKLHDRIKNKGYSNPDFIIWQAVKAGHFKGDPVLNIIAANLKKLQNEKDVILKSEYPNYEIPSHPFNYRIDKAKAYNKERFTTFLSQGLDAPAFLGMSKQEFEGLGHAGVKRFYKEIEALWQDTVDSGIDPINFGSRKAGRNPFNNSNLIFKDDNWEFGFVKEFGDIREGIVGSQVSFYKFQAVKAAERSVMSDKPGLQFSAMKDYIIEKFGMTAEEANLELEGLVEYWRGTFHPHNTIDETFALIGLAVQQGINSVLLGAVNIRNILWDNTFHHAFVKYVHTGKSKILTTVEKMARLSAANAVGWGKGIASVVRGKFPSGDARKLTRKDELLADAAENAGLVIRVSQADMVMGVLRRSADTDPLLSRSGKDTKAREVARAAARFFSGLADLSSIITGAEATNKVARIDGAIASTSIMNRFFNENSWESLSKQDRALMMRFGFTKELYDVLKGVKRNENGYIDHETFKNIDVSSLVDEFTTPAQARSHVKNMYLATLSQVLDEYAPLPGVKGELNLYSPKGLGGLILKLVFKYSNIALSSVSAFMKNAYAFAGLDPNKIANTKNILAPIAWATELTLANPKFAGEVMLYLASGGAFVIWAGQMKNNEPLEAITPEFLGKALLKSPAFGMVSEILQGWYWGEGLIGDVTKPVVQTGLNLGRAGLSIYDGKETKAMQNLLRAKQTFPITNMWWLNVGIDKAVRNGWDIPYTRYQKTRFKKRGKLSEQFE